MRAAGKVIKDRPGFEEIVNKIGPDETDDLYWEEAGY